MRRMLLLAGLGLVVIPRNAWAGTARIDGPYYDKQYPDGVAYLNFVANAGERNVVTVAKGADGAVYLRDSGAPLTGGRRCHALDAHAVRCNAQATLLISIYAGDRDDAVDAASGAAQYPSALVLLGEEGDDVLSGDGSLVGGPGRDVLQGGDGGDRLSGGGGDDVLQGGGGDDMLFGDGNTGLFDEDASPGGDDVLDGGAGSDTVSYDDRKAGVHVDLAAHGPAGEAGERDTLTAVERVIGGEGADVLVGDGAANELRGYAGDDAISGRAGDDVLDGGDGADTLHGGDGDDTLTAGFIALSDGEDAGDRAFGESGNDVLSTDDAQTLLDGGPGDDQLWFTTSIRSAGLGCGSGEDTLAGLLHGQLVAADCEALQVSDRRAFTGPLLTMPTAPALHGTVFELPLTSPRTAHWVRRCQPTLSIYIRRLTARKLLLGRRGVVVRRGRTRVVRVHVRKSSRSALEAAVAPTLQLGLRGACVGRQRDYALRQRFNRRWRVKLPGSRLTRAARVG
jgi:RTX calcium-binding nonapeptide repeat (4 copies)